MKELICNADINDIALCICGTIVLSVAIVAAIASRLAREIMVQLAVVILSALATVGIVFGTAALIKYWAGC